MGIKEINEQLGAIQKQYDDAVEGVRNNGLKELFKEIFETSDIKGIAWTQSIPSFNDGDPCVFSTGEIYFTFEPLNPAMENWGGAYLDDDPEHGNWGESLYDFSEGYINRTVLPGKEAAVEVVEFISSNQDLMEKLFGSNAAILVTPEEIKVQEYNCGY